jgi:biopolymer transport protein ExbB/TolQ
LKTDFNATPEQETILILRCFFYQLVCKDECFEARQRFLELRKLIQETEASQAKQEWLDAIEQLRNEINKEAQKRFEMVVIPTE